MRGVGYYRVWFFDEPDNPFSDGVEVFFDAVFGFSESWKKACELLSMLPFRYVEVFDPKTDDLVYAAFKAESGAIVGNFGSGGISSESSSLVIGA